MYVRYLMALSKLALSVVQGFLCWMDERYTHIRCTIPSLREKLAIIIAVTMNTSIKVATIIHYPVAMSTCNPPYMKHSHEHFDHEHIYTTRSIESSRVIVALKFLVLRGDEVIGTTIH